MKESSSLFASVIEEHLALKRRNAELDRSMPLDHYIPADPFENHALFKTEQAARREEEETGEHPAVPEMSEDTESMPAVSPAETQPRGWMETTQATEFSWD